MFLDFISCGQTTPCELLFPSLQVQNQITLRTLTQESLSLSLSFQPCRETSFRRVARCSSTLNREKRAEFLIAMRGETTRDQNGNLAKLNILQIKWKSFSNYQYFEVRRIGPLLQEWMKSVHEINKRKLNYSDINYIVKQGKAI